MRASHFPRRGRYARLLGTLALFAIGTSSIQAETFLVSTNADTNNVNPRCVFPCSFREALNAANATPGFDTLHFSIAVTQDSVGILSPTTALPTIRERVFIDGTSMPFSTQNTAVVGTNAFVHLQLNGANTPRSANGLTFAAGSDGSEVRGIAITGFRNSTAGLGGHGIVVNAGVDGIFLNGCFIGVDPDGVTANPNEGQGISAASATTLLVGGPTIASRNLISGNLGHGLVVGDGAVVQNNLIGTQRDGFSARGNGGAGIHADGNGIHIGAAIGTAGSNVIANNGGNGVEIVGDTSTVSVLGNSIVANVGLGIDNGADGVDVNDEGDGDSGPNGRLNAPVLLSAGIANLRAYVTGIVRGTPGATLRIEYFTSTIGDPSGSGEGERPQLGFDDVVTDANGQATISRNFAVTNAALGHRIAAIATDVAGNRTSEFSTVRVFVGARVVTTSADSGAGSLRTALSAANLNMLIAFDIPGAGPHTISPSTALSALGGASTLDGFTQPGSVFGSAGLLEPNNTVLKIVLSGAAAPGANGYGLDVNGDATGPSEVRGIAIGGFRTGATTLASQRAGVRMKVDSTFGNTVVQGCFIGTDASGTVANPNDIGVLVTFTSRPNRVGGLASPWQRNLIAGNSTHAVYLDNATNVSIAGNVIGLARDGTTALPNGGDGIHVDAGQENAIGLAGATANVIAMNGGNAVAITGTVPQPSVTVRSLSSFGNAGIAIDLGANGVTANDIDDLDAGPNGLQNFPSAMTASVAGDTTTVSGILDRSGSGNITVAMDLYADTLCDATGNGEGRHFVATTQVTVPVSDQFVAVFDAAPPAGTTLLTLTATRDGTSEFSTCIPFTVLTDALFQNSFE